MSSRPRDIRGASPSTSLGSSPLPSSQPRYVSTARLASPVPSGHQPRSPPISPAQITADKQTELPAIENPSSLPGPGQSALAAALARSDDQGHSPKGTLLQRAPSPAVAGLGSHDRISRSNYGSFDTREASGSPVPFQDPEIVRRHLVQPDSASGRYGSPMRPNAPVVGQGLDADEFSSLRLQGGDITRPIYRYADGSDGSSGS